MEERGLLWGRQLDEGRFGRGAEFEAGVPIGAVALGELTLDAVEFREPTLVALKGLRCERVPVFAAGGWHHLDAAAALLVGPGYLLGCRLDDLLANLHGGSLCLPGSLERA